MTDTLWINTLAGNWVSGEFLEDTTVQRFADHGEGLVRFREGTHWATYQVVGYDLARHRYSLGRMVASSDG